jgi:hypothetical protein
MSDLPRPTWGIILRTAFVVWLLIFKHDNSMSMFLAGSILTFAFWDYLELPKRRKGNKNV